MINLEIYNGRQLQTFLSLLNQFEGDGLNDIRFIREKINNHLTDRRKNFRINVNSHKISYGESAPICLKCGLGRMQKVLNPDGLNIYGCTKCRYSEITEDRNDK